MSRVPVKLRPRTPPPPRPVTGRPAAPEPPPRHILLVKTSSLGDVVHNLPVVSDLHRMFPEAQIDWVVEEAYAEIPRLHPGVRRTIPVALRRWRRRLTQAATWREMRAALVALRATEYDLILDTQGLVKSALLAAMAQRSGIGQRCGYCREAAREPLAAVFYDEGFAIPKNLHAIERNRWLAAAACGYAPDLPFDYGLANAMGAAAVSRQREYAILLTGTSRIDKLWPEAHWQVLIGALVGRGLRCLLPAGSDAERVRAMRLAASAPQAVEVLPPQSIGALAGVCAGARVVVGLDTGLTHLAAALGRPTLALFGGSDPGLTGVYAGDPPLTPVCNLGAVATPPEPTEVCVAIDAWLER